MDGDQRGLLADCRLVITHRCRDNGGDFPIPAGTRFQRVGIRLSRNLQGTKSHLRFLGGARQDVQNLGGDGMSVFDHSRRKLDVGAPSAIGARQIRDVFIFCDRQHRIHARCEELDHVKLAERVRQPRADVRSVEARDLSANGCAGASAWSASRRVGELPVVDMS